MTILPPEAIAGLFNDGVKPVFLLGAGASVSSGVPLAGQLVESMAKFAFCKATARTIDDPTLMRSDWYDWLEQRRWFRRDVSAADLYPLAVEDLLQPTVNRKEFFQTILRRGLEPNDGYQRLISLMAKRAIGTILTTNFDDLVARCAKSTRAVGHCDEIKTPSDYAMFDTASTVPQVVYLHGSVDHYSDKNLVDETRRLDDDLVDLLRPLLRDRPLVVVGYRGAEPSVMRHLLADQAAACMNFRRGIYWCFRKGSDALAESNLLRELHSVVRTNLQLVEIDGFDGLMVTVDKLVSAAPTAARQSTGAQLRNLPFDMQSSDITKEELSEILLRSKLKAYAEALREEAPVFDSADQLAIAMQEHHLAVSDGATFRITNGAQLLFAKRPETQVDKAWIDVSVNGPAVWVAAVLDTSVASTGESESLTVAGNLWEQLDQAATLLSRVNKPFRMKGAVSHTAYPYPPLALKELLTNLIAHRSYVDDEPARLVVSPDAIVFENPGGLVDVVKLELEDESLQEVIGIESRSPKGYRNPVVADFFYSAGAMDKAGSGLPDVVQLAANNLNKVTFGPVADNRRFVATIKCRPEALQVNSETGTAKPAGGEHRYVANLLRVVEWPTVLWRIGTVEDAKEINKLDRLGVAPFGCARGWVWTFADRDTPMAEQLFDLAVEDEIYEVSIDAYLSDRDAPSVVPQLLNRALAMRLGRLGLMVRYEAGRLKAYYPSLDGEPREINYRSTFKQTRRTVAKPVVSRSTGKVVYWEHKAVYLRFEQFGKSWALSLLPSYVFTVNGDSKFIASERIGPLSTRRASRDYNPTVMHDLVFWSRMLSEEHDDTTFRLALTRHAAGPVATISSSIPSFVFQDSLDVGPFEGEEVEFAADLGEESEELQEQIELAAAEAATETIRDEDTNR